MSWKLSRSAMPGIWLGDAGGLLQMAGDLQELRRGRS